VTSVLAPLAAQSDLLGWLVLAAFVAGSALEIAGRREPARYVTSGAWGIFAVFWLSVFPHFLFEVKSAVEGIGSLVAIPLCLYTGYLLLSGRDSLFTLSRAVGLMGLLYYPTQAVPIVREVLIETVAVQTMWGINLLGYDPAFVVHPDPAIDLKNYIRFDSFATYIVYACTGIGAISIFGGLIAAVDAPLSRKLKSFAAAVGIIWVLNIARNVFVAVAAGKLWFNVGPIEAVAGLAGVTGVHVSFWFAHSIIAQFLSVFALVGITWLVVKELPEMLGPLEDVLFIATGSEYDLQAALGVTQVRADGGTVEDDG